MRRIIWSIVPATAFLGAGCAGAPDGPTEPTADPSAGAAASQESSGSFATSERPGVEGTTLPFGTVGPPASTRYPGTVSRASVFGRPSGSAADDRPSSSTFPQSPEPSAELTGAVDSPAASPSTKSPPPDPAVQQAGFLRRLLGSSASSSASPSSASPSPKAPSNQSSAILRLPERQRLHEKLLFYPTRHPDGRWKPNGLEPEDVTFAATDGTQLHGWYLPCESPRAYVLYAHGNGGNLTYNDAVYRKLGELRVAVFAFDYRGYGRSAGKPTVPGVVDDSRCARAWLARRADIPESAIVLMGRSLGGAVVVQLAGELPPRGLILESTFSSLREVADHHFSKLSWLVPRDELNSAAVLAAYRGPLFASHGDADRTIPPGQGKKLYEAARGPKQFFHIAGGDHNDPQVDEYYRRLDRFFAELPGEG